MFRMITYVLWTMLISHASLIMIIYDGLLFYKLVVDSLMNNLSLLRSKLVNWEKNTLNKTMQGNTSDIP